jgi:hypothetical protein
MESTACSGRYATNFPGDRGIFTVILLPRVKGAVLFISDFSPVQFYSG